MSTCTRKKNKCCNLSTWQVLRRHQHFKCRL